MWLKIIAMSFQYFNLVPLVHEILETIMIWNFWNQAFFPLSRQKILKYPTLNLSNSLSSKCLTTGSESNLKKNTTSSVDPGGRRILECDQCYQKCPKWSQKHVFCIHEVWYVKQHLSAEFSMSTIIWKIKPYPRIP